MVQNLNRATLLIFSVILMIAVSGLSFAASPPDVLNENDTSSSRIGIQVLEVEINNDIVDNGDDVLTSFEESQDIKIRVKLYAESGAKDVEVTAFITGFDLNTKDSLRMSDTTEPFDAQAGVIYNKNLKIKLPVQLDKDSYKLRLMISDRYSTANVYNYNLLIEPIKHNIMIKDVVLSPAYEVIGGRALLTTVLLKNNGDKDEEEVKITAGIPELGISGSDFIDQIDSGDSTTSEEIYFRIPDCARPGVYEVLVEVTYRDGFEEVTDSRDIRVVQSETCTPQEPTPTPGPVGPQTIITLGADSQDVFQGKGGAAYPVTITNNGQNTKVYTLAIIGVDQFGSARVSPSNTMIIQPGETQSAFVFVSAKENAPVGDNSFLLEVSSDDKVLKQIGLRAKVIKGETAGWGNVKKALEIGLVVLVVLLVILGLVIGFNKLKGEGAEEEEQGNTQTYY